MMMMMKQFERFEKSFGEDGGDFDGSGGVRAGRAFRQLHQSRRRVDQAPVGLVEEYLGECRRKLGAEVDDSWAPWQVTATIQWGRMLGLKRIHFHLSKILGRLLAGQLVEGQAHVTQLIKSIHQAVLDGGSWDAASLLLPDEDPVRRATWGASTQELEAIAGYQDALRRIRRGPSNSDDPENTGEKPKGGGGKGKDKDKNKKEGDGL